MILLDLDENTALLILRYLGAKDLISLQIACKWGRTLATHDCLWITLCTERFSILNTHLFPASPTGHQASHSGLCASSPQLLMDSNVFGSPYTLYAVFTLHRPQTDQYVSTIQGGQHSPMAPGLANSSDCMGSKMAGGLQALLRTRSMSSPASSPPCTPSMPLPCHGVAGVTSLCWAHLMA